MGAECPAEVLGAGKQTPIVPAVIRPAEYLLQAPAKEGDQTRYRKDHLPKTASPQAAYPLGVSEVADPPALDRAV